MLHGYSESTRPSSVGSSYGRLPYPQRTANLPNNVDGILLFVVPANTHAEAHNRRIIDSLPSPHFDWANTPNVGIIAVLPPPLWKNR